MRAVWSWGRLPLGFLVMIRRKALAIWVTALVAVGACAAEGAYQTGPQEAVEVAQELAKTLDRKAMGMLAARPLAVQEDGRPWVRLAEENGAGGTAKVGVVTMSTGFLDLVSRVAHAKAIDRVRKGYLEGYVRAWPVEGDGGGVPALPDIGNPQYWTDEVMDMQITYFSQMIGVAVGIKFANYYLGQFQRHGAQLAGASDQMQALTQVLSPSDWEAAMKAGARNSLDCAYGVDGLVALYDCVDRLPKRPTWTLYFAPQADVVKLSKLKKDLAKLERDFFAGR